MTWVSGILVFWVIWWVVFLTLLPFKVQVDPCPAKGHASSAPQKSYLKQKALLATLLTLILWSLIDWGLQFVTLEDLKAYGP